MSETINIWSDEAEQYDSCRPRPPLILLDILTQLAQTQHPVLVVDLGSGTGLSTLIWSERAQQVIGIEPNDSMRQQAYYDVIARFRAIRAEQGFDRNVTSWSKDKHLDRMRDSDRFRYVKEITIHHNEEGNAERFIALTLSYGIARYLKLSSLSEKDFDLDHLKDIAQQVIGKQPIPWYFSYRVRIGIT